MINQTLLANRTFDYIYHISDIHFRNLKRHTEYRKVLSQFIQNVKTDNLPNALIYIAGDIAHAKTEMSPELVREISWFLIECANLHPTILITGNHDCNQNNPSRLDVLTPIVDAINHPHLYYFRDTGVYNFGDLTFGVFSILSHRSEWPKGTDVVGDHKICLFHGPVNKSQTDVGYTVSNVKFTPEMFDGYDLALLGDIHRRQVVQEYSEEYIEVNEDDVENYLEQGWEIHQNEFEEILLNNI
jgi:DNA repair exonuclease SbcCD nuclease subunit